MKKWRKHNPNYFKYREAKDTTWKETCKDRAKKWRDRHQEYLKLYRQEHKDRYRIYMREYMKEYRRKKRVEKHQKEFPPPPERLNKPQEGMEGRAA